MTTLDVVGLVESEITTANGACKTCAWLASRPAEEAAKWDQVLADKARYPNAAVARAMVKAAPESRRIPSRDGIANHRNGGHRR